MMGLTLYAGVVLISLMGSAIVGPMWTNGSGRPPLLERCHFVLDTGHHFNGQQRMPVYEYDFPEIYRSARVFVTIYSMYGMFCRSSWHFAKPFFPVRLKRQNDCLPGHLAWNNCHWTPTVAPRLKMLQDVSCNNRYIQGGFRFVSFFECFESMSGSRVVLGKLCCSLNTPELGTWSSWRKNFWESDSWNSSQRRDTWPIPWSEADCSAAQDQLRHVKQIQVAQMAFAAILADGSVVTWGRAEFGGDSSACQDQLRNVKHIQSWLSGETPTKVVIARQFKISSGTCK